MIQHVEQSGYLAIITSQPYAVIMFYANWDGGTFLLLPHLKRAAQMYRDGPVAFGMANFEVEVRIATELRLVDSPALVFYRDGIVVKILYKGYHTVSDQVDCLLAGKEILPTPEPPDRRIADDSCKVDDPIPAKTDVDWWTWLSRLFGRA